MKYIFKLFIIISLLISTASSVTAEIRSFFDYFDSYKDKEFTFDVFFDDDYVFDEIIMDVKPSRRAHPILLKASPENNHIMALLKLECMQKICSVTGHFDFEFELSVFSKRIERKFIVNDYSTTLSNNGLSLAEAYGDILNVKLNLEGASSWADHTELFWIVDDLDSMLKAKIDVHINHFTKEEKINLVKTCFNKCKTISVIGYPFFSNLGWLSFKAEKLNIIKDN
jgi:hypothetical protein